MPKRLKKAPRVEYLLTNNYEHGEGMKEILHDTEAAGKIRALVANDHILKETTNPSRRLS